VIGIAPICHSVAASSAKSTVCAALLSRTTTARLPAADMLKRLSGSGQQYEFMITVDGDDAQAFTTSLPESKMKNSLQDFLLVPFIQQVNHSKSTRIACSRVEVNGRARGSKEIQSPLRTFVEGGSEPTKVHIRLEEVSTIKARASSMPREFTGSRMHTLEAAPGGVSSSSAAERPRESLIMILDEIVPTVDHR